MFLTHHLTTDGMENTPEIALIPSCTLLQRTLVLWTASGRILGGPCVVQHLNLMVKLNLDPGISAQNPIPIPLAKYSLSS